MPKTSSVVRDLVALAALAALALSGCQGGAGRPGMAPRTEVEFETFNAADTDLDGRLDPAEARAALPDIADHFRLLDTDVSGYLSWAEVKAARYGVYRMPPPDEGLPR